MLKLISTENKIRAAVSRTSLWTKLLLVTCLGVVLRLAVLVIFSHTRYQPVDVYYVDIQSSQAIINFQNPYAQVFSVHGTNIQLLAYLPFVPLYYSPFLLFGDIRYG